MVKVKSYANIAIVKYWGKKDAEKMIPSTAAFPLLLTICLQKQSWNL